LKQNNLVLLFNCACRILREPQLSGRHVGHLLVQKLGLHIFFLRQFLNPRIAFFLGGVRADPRCVRLRYDVYFVEPIVFERSVVGALFGNLMLCSIWRELCW